MGPIGIGECIATFDAAKVRGDCPMIPFGYLTKLEILPLGGSETRACFFTSAL